MITSFNEIHIRVSKLVSNRVVVKVDKEVLQYFFLLPLIP